METAYLMALIESTDGNKAEIKHFAILSDQHPTCSLQTQSYAIIESVHHNTYGQAREILLNSVRNRARMSAPDSLWQQIYDSLKGKK